MKSVMRFLPYVAAISIACSAAIKHPSRPEYKGVDCIKLTVPVAVLNGEADARVTANAECGDYVLLSWSQDNMVVGNSSWSIDTRDYPTRTKRINMPYRGPAMVKAVLYKGNKQVCATRREIDAH